MSRVASALLERGGAETFALYDRAPVSVSAFLADVDRAAQRLPGSRKLINTCEDRYAFLVAFFAAALAGRTSLLPPSRATTALAQLVNRHPDAQAVDDAVALPGVASVPPGAPKPDGPRTVDDHHVAAIAFTSGSTGEPQPQPKRWGALRTASRLHAQQLSLSSPAYLISTVPPWHMYGLEWSALIAAVAPLTVYCGRTFYPGDVRTALATCDGPRVLVTTPVHLRALLRAAADLPPVEVVVCATAPLQRELAEAAERAFRGQLLEIYGCTEAGTIAHRRTTQEPAWCLFPGFALRREGDCCFVDAPFLDAEAPLADRLTLEPDGRFRLGGRRGDLLKVAGRRASLAQLTAALLAVEGVEDGVVFDPSHGAGERPCALVVAPGLTGDTVRRRLAQLIDPVFLPRPLRLVDRLPRSGTGKLPMSALVELMAAAPRD